MRENYHIAESEVGFLTIRREIEKFRVEYGVDLEFLRGAELTRVEDEIAKRMIFSIECKIALKKFASKTVRFPATWWDAFKHRFFPSRMLKKWPVKWDEVTLEASAYHPDVAIPNKQTFVEIMHASRKAIYQDWPDSTYSESR